ncbi:PAS domain S-box protein [Zeaxanthinibacter enoshimensis]|uniref:PAS domain-containing sensor histidine kinase n=1 Tax=Zeaxanthinibacter enoshimensis TaxID=392009 RepID=UPI0035675F06
MENKEVILLKKALERQKKARKQAERILEAKSKELYATSRKLEETNERLENLLSQKTSELEGVFINIVDPYVVMDLSGRVIKMNNAAKEFLGYDCEIEQLDLNTLVHPDYTQYTRESFMKLTQAGTLKNYRAKIFVRDGSEKYVQVNGSLIYNKHNEAVAAQGIIRDITQETEVKQLLAEQKRQLDIIVENSPLGIVLTVKGKILKANKAFGQMLGYPDTKLKNLRVTDISAPEDQAESVALMSRIDRGELDTFSMVKKYRTKTGQTLLAKTTVSAVRDASGNIVYQVAMVDDITKEIAAENLLKASQSRLSSLISNLQMGVLLENEDRRVELTNIKFCELFGIPAKPDDLKGMDCRAAIQEVKEYFTDPDGFVNRIESILQQKEVVLSDELEMKDGRILERDFIPIYNQDIYQGHLWTYTDVTLRKTYKKNLEIQKEKYSSIIANMNLGLIEVDNNDVIQLVNQSFCSMSGYSEQELLGHKASEILLVQNTGFMEQKNHDRKNSISDSYEIEIKTKNGNIRHWLISGAPRYDEQGEVVGSIGIHLDITEQKELELQKENLLKELEASNQGLQDYAHIVSHDLKSPLRSISALATWLNDDYVDVLDENGVFNLQMMQEKVEAMDKLIDGILKYSSIHETPSLRQKVDLNEVVREIREIIYIPEHVNIVIMNTLPTVDADPTKMHQLFQNLLSNAAVNIENPEGVVRIFSEENETHFKLGISDNGVGIPEEYHKKIFEIFQSLGEGERSTGIGLSIVKKIVTLYGGEIWLESKVGIGTTFYFTILK